MLKWCLLSWEGNGHKYLGMQSEPLAPVINPETMAYETLEYFALKRNVGWF